MNAVILIVSVGVEYPSLLSTVDRVGVVGCIPALKGCLLPTNRVSILAERDRRARLKSSASIFSTPLWNNYTGIDYRRSIPPHSRYHCLNRLSLRFSAFKIPLKASETSGYDSMNLWVKDSVCGEDVTHRYTSSISSQQNLLSSAW